MGEDHNHEPEVPEAGTPIAKLKKDTSKDLDENRNTSQEMEEEVNDELGLGIN